LFRQGIELYLQMRWQEAGQKFAEAQQVERFPDNRITPSLVYMKRCEDFAKNPPVPAGEVSSFFRGPPRSCS